MVSCLVKDQRGLTIANDTRIIRWECRSEFVETDYFDQFQEGATREIGTSNAFVGAGQFEARLGFL